MQDISRAAAAINILDDYLKGYPLEKVLKQWFKKNRFAGSNDRRNIRDLVFDILRKRLILYYPFQINEYVETGGCYGNVMHNSMPSTHKLIENPTSAVYGHTLPDKEYTNAPLGEGEEALFMFGIYL